MRGGECRMITITLNNTGMMERRERKFKTSSKISNVNKVISSGNLRVPTCLKHGFLSEPTVSDTTHHHLGITTA